MTCILLLMGTMHLIAVNPLKLQSQAVGSYLTWLLGTKFNFSVSSPWFCS